MTRSEFVTGRLANQRAFRLAQRHGTSFAVLCFRCLDGTVMYADVTYAGPRETLTSYKPRGGVSNIRMRYRVVVTPKRV